LIQDGAAVVEFLAWLEFEIHQNNNANKITEYQAAEKLR